MTNTELPPAPPLEWPDEIPEARCTMKPEHVRPFLRALGKRYPKADVCPKQRAAMSFILGELGLPPYKLLKESNVI